MTQTLLISAALILAACGKPIVEADVASPAIATSSPQSQATSTAASKASPQRPDVWSYKVLATYPHGERYFTQGLFFHDGVLFETTGKFGESVLVRHDILGNADKKITPLPTNVFGEGSVAVGDKIISVTWREGVGHIHDLETLEQVDTFPLAGEGWGLTYDGEKLILSDGTDRLRFLNPTTFEEFGGVPVRFGTRPVPRLNELEMVGDELWANIWQTDIIARINPANGQVLGFINLEGISPENAGDPNFVLNGIAYDADADRLIVTGKRWANFYEIEIVKD